MKVSKLIAAGAAVIVGLFSQTVSAGAPQREHRSIWMSPFLGSNWPSSGITEANSASQKRILTQRIEKFRNQNINVLYYHCRSMCDATYESSYEPWSSTVSGTRGKAPAFDPFGFLLETAHEAGIEVYAWINPYRYCSKTKYGEAGGDLNYENSHPDWLISQTNETILNPGLEEVKQRIVDVISEIVTKYDVDGVIFDDYFYTNGTPMSLDADLYNKYKSGGGTLSQADWRRANVNEMVERVSKAIKAIKPHVVFGISPAGVASPPTVTSEYGLPAAPGGGDWQYNGIYSDPLAWLKAGTIDFMSPQIYWPGRFDALSEWWANAAAKFNRHCYPSVTLSSITTYKYAEFAREIEYNRTVSPSGASGFVFFQYADLVNYYEKWDGKNTEMGAILAQDVFNTKALVPLRPWVKSDDPDMVSNITNDGTALAWTATKAGRYAVYKLPNTQTSGALTLDGITYTNSYTLPADGADYSWYVAAYDRYGKLSTPLGVGASKETGTAPELVYPADGESPVDLFEFKWNHESHLQQYNVEVAEDAAFNSIIGSIEATGKSASVTGLPTLTQGKKYFWRVKATDVNREHPVSAVRSFIAPKIAITTPAASGRVALDGTFEWTAAVEGAEYTLEIAKTAEMTVPVHTATVKTTSYKLPSHTLTTGTNYFARVTARVDNASSTSAIVAFATEDKDDYAAPVFVVPSKDNETLYSNQSIAVAPWDGMANIVVQIATTNTFPSRSSYSYTLSDFGTETPVLSDIKISSSALKDGTEYFLRARGTYNLTTAVASQYTDYTPTYVFVYSSQAGVGDLTVDEAATWLENNTTLHVEKGVEAVRIYSLSGALVAEWSTTGGDTLDLSGLPSGIYLVKAGNSTLKLVR